MIETHRDRGAHQPTATMTRVLMLAIAVLGGSCSAPPPPSDSALSIELRWIKSYVRESRADVETGLLWTLSSGWTSPMAPILFHGMQTSSHFVWTMLESTRTR